MNIVLFSNTFTPHVGGVARSVESFMTEYRRRGHRVLVVAPDYPDLPAEEVDVVRIPAIQKFNASDFSFALPVPIGLTEILEDFEPDVIHAQHPFLLGNTALRFARYFGRPLVFTHHTLYEQYTHYVPGDLPLFKRFIIELGTRYANLCDQVFAPSESIRDILARRGVTAPIKVVPTGVWIENFAQGDGAGFRAAHGIDPRTFVAGHLGRLAPEKNLGFLAESMVEFLRAHENACFLVVGAGPSEEDIEGIFEAARLRHRLVMAGVLQGQALADALNAMDLFAFASKSETQGMVLTEAMAAGLPVVALDAPGAREVVKDRYNGRLLREETPAAFRDALDWVAAQPPEEMERLVGAARATAGEFSMQRSAEKALKCYELLRENRRLPEMPREAISGWEQVIARLKAEWDIIKNVSQAGDEALLDSLFREKDQAP